MSCFQFSQTHLYTFNPSGHFWSAACRGCPYRGDGGWQVSSRFLFSDSIVFSLSSQCIDWIWVTGLTVNYVMFLPFSLELLGEQEVTEWRDTAQLYQEEVRNKRVFFRIKCSVFISPRLMFPSLILQKMLLRYYLFEGLRYVWQDRKGAFFRVRYWNRKSRNT